MKGKMKKQLIGLLAILLVVLVLPVVSVKASNQVYTVQADGTVTQDANYDGPQITKIRVLKEGRFLEIYWDRYVDEEEAIDVSNFALKNGNQTISLIGNYEDAWGWTDTLYFDKNNKNIAATAANSMARLEDDLHMSSICFPESELKKLENIDENGLTLEVKGKTIVDKNGNSAKSAVYTGVPRVNYYTQQVISETGIIIKADDSVAKESLKLAAAQVDVQLGKAGTGMAETMQEWGCSLAVYSPHQNVYLIPEHRYGFSSSMYDVEGYGGNEWNNCTSSIAERNIVRTKYNAVDPDLNTGYPDENILIHEFGHCVKSIGLDKQADQTLVNEFYASYENAKENGLWNNTYAIANPDEFFATMCTVWFNVMSESSSWNDGVRCPINTREEMRRYDPQTYAFFEKIFEKTSLPAPWDEPAPDVYHKGVELIESADDFEVQECEDGICLSEYYGHKGAEELHIPDKINGLPVVEFGDNLFAGMTDLKKITIPSTVDVIGASCFEDCTSLTTINIQGNVEYEIGEDAFKETPWYDELQNECEGQPVVIGTTVYDMIQCADEVTIPDGATKIAWSAWDEFYNEETCQYETGFTAFTIPASLKELGSERALADSEDLQSITVEAGNEKYYSIDGILYSEVDDVTALLVYPAKKTGINFNVPAEVDVVYNVHNKNLKKVTFAGDSVSLAGSAFAGCTSLTSVTLPDEVYMGNSVFEGTAIKSIHLPAKCELNVDSSGTPFNGMSRLTTITVDKANKEYKIVNGALCSYGDDWNIVVCYPAAKTGTTFTIPSGIKTVYSLDEAKYLTTIIVPKSVTGIYGQGTKMKKINTIKYLGTKTQWKDVYCGNPNEGRYTIKNIYYECKSLSSAKATIAKASYTYTGKAIKPVVTVRRNGTKVGIGNYSVSYKNNVLTGKATITITGKGKYYGTLTKTFKIVPKQIKNVKVKSSAKRQMKVSWTKNITASGYAIQYATNSGFTKNVKTVYVTSNKTSSRTIKSLKSGKTYYVRVRAYKLIDGKRCYGSYSLKKKIKVK